jgi:hypothetical protein
MDEIRYTLISDGPSDRALIPILNWVLREKGDVSRIQAEWADLGRLPKPPRSLRARILCAIDLFPCDLLFVHRDAERQDPKTRCEEILSAVREAALQGFKTPAVCVVPVQMTEAWLLFDECAIRHAAGNPNGKSPLSLPKLSEIEQIPDPKANLFKVLRDASGLRGRHLKKFNPGQARVRITELIADFSSLRALRAFQNLEEMILILGQDGWSWEAFVS